MAEGINPSNRRSFFQSVLPIHNPLHHRDEEDTIAMDSSSNARHQAELGEQERSRRKGDLVSSSDQLAMFRTLVGIDNPPGLHASTFFRSRRPAQNIGIYGRVINAETKAHRSHRMFSLLINGCLGLQLIVAAALTALGAGNGPHRAVTAFGAINTVIAGFLTYLKGSGLPNRLGYYENEWTKVREYIEQRERDFCREGCTLDLEAEVAVIERMYEEVKGDVEANTPDSFVSVTDITKRRGTINPAPALADVGGRAVDGMMERVVDPTTKSVAALKRNLSYQSSHLGEKVSGYGERVTSFVEKPYTVSATISADRPHSPPVGKD